ncbi:MAG: glycosyltransferase [Solirubrobacterales bacterium]|nr:glycosyltransferase [Solirubrobacterales bacterium]
MGHSSPLRNYRSVALVHDFIVDLRGGERVFLELCELFPEATIYSPIYNAEGSNFRFEERGVVTSGLQKLRPTAKSFRRLLPFYPRAVESLDLSGHDLILSSSSAWSHGVVAGPGQRHVCYCHNPFRYAWDQRDEALQGRRFPVTKVLARVLGRWRAWDKAVSSEVDMYIANGEITRERIARSFGRSSSVLHPPVDVGRFSEGTPGERFVVLSELMPHKRIDVTVSACSRLGIPLTVIGDGPDLARLQSLAGPTIEFAGRVTDKEVALLLSGAAALIQCATEEFGIASVEAQAAGRPVLALAAGGALETVVEGQSGEFFDEADEETLVAALQKFEPHSYDPAACRHSAERFSSQSFADGLAAELARLDDAPTAPRLRYAERRRGLWRSPIA